MTSRRSSPRRDSISARRASEPTVAVFKRMSRAEIREHFTHRGWYFFVPIYLTLDDCPKVSARNGVPEWLMDLAEAVFGACVFVRSLLDPDYEPLYPLRVTGEITFKE